MAVRGRTDAERLPTQIRAFFVQTVEFNHPSEKLYLFLIIGNTIHREKTNFRGCVDYSKPHEMRLSYVKKAHKMAAFGVEAFPLPQSAKKGG